MYVKITQAPHGITSNRWLDLETTNEQHHSLKCISSSHIKYLASGKSPLAYHAKFISKSMKPYFSEEFRIGTIAHLAVLEPERFEKSVVVCDLDQRTNEFRDLKRSMAAENKVQSAEPSQLESLEHKLAYLNKELEESDSKEQTKVIKDKIKKAKIEVSEIKNQEKKSNDEVTIVTTKDGGFLDSKGQEIFLVKSEEMKMYRTFQRRYDEHKRLNVMVNDCVIEQSGVAQDPETGLWMSLRGDARCERGYFLDPKTMADELSADNISRYASTYHLALQHVHYIDTANLIEPNTYRKFFFVMMSKKEPYEVALVQLDSEAVAWARHKRREILNQIAQCEESGKWPSVDYNYETKDSGLLISLPRWAMK